MSITKNFFGALPDGKPIDCYIIENQKGMRAEILTYGGTLNKLYVPDQNGMLADVLIGFDTLEGHLNYSDYQGMLVGRYANRIADGAFVLNGEEYHVTKMKTTSPACMAAVNFHMLCGMLSLWGRMRCA